MTTNNTDDKETTELHTLAERRAFLKQLGAVALVALGSGWAALAPPNWPLSLRDPDGERGKPREDIFRLPENGFRAEASSVLPVMGIARGANVDTSVRAAIDARRRSTIA